MRKKLCHVTELFKSVKLVPKNKKLLFYFYMHFVLSDSFALIGLKLSNVNSLRALLAVYYLELN